MKGEWGLFASEDRVKALLSHSKIILWVYSVPSLHFESDILNPTLIVGYCLFLYVRYSTRLHLPPLRFHCVGGCCDRTQYCCDYAIDSQTLQPLGYISPTKDPTLDCNAMYLQSEFNNAKELFA